MSFASFMCYPEALGYMCMCKQATSLLQPLSAQSDQDEFMRRN